MKCPICKEIEIKEGDNLACINCQMTGRYMEFVLMEPTRSEVLKKIRELPNVLTAYLWPSDRQKWVLSIMLEDGRIATPLAVIETPMIMRIADEEIPTKMLAPIIPTMDQAWKIMITESDGEGGWKGDPIMIEEEFTDETLPTGIAEL